MNYYNTPRLVTLEGEGPELGVLPIIAKIGQFAFGKIRKRVRLKRKKRAKRRKLAKERKMQRERESELRAVMYMQAQRRNLETKKRKQKNLLTLVIPAGIAAVMLMGKDK